MDIRVIIIQEIDEVWVSLRLSREKDKGIGPGVAGILI